MACFPFEKLNIINYLGTSFCVFDSYSIPFPNSPKIHLHLPFLKKKKKKGLESNHAPFWWLSYKISCFLRTENQFHAMVINETGFKVLIDLYNGEQAFLVLVENHGFNYKHVHRQICADVHRYVSLCTHMLPSSLY